MLAVFGSQLKFLNILGGNLLEQDDGEGAVLRSALLVVAALFGLFCLSQVFVSLFFVFFVSLLGF